MLKLSNKADCRDCIYNLRVVQEDSIEETEYWSCDKYIKIPIEISAKEKSCKYNKNN